MKPLARTDRVYASDCGVPEYIAAATDDLLLVDEAEPEDVPEDEPLRHLNFDSEGRVIVWLKELRDEAIRLAEDGDTYGIKALQKAWNSVRNAGRGRPKRSVHLVVTEKSLIPSSDDTRPPDFAIPGYMRVEASKITEIDEDGKRTVIKERDAIK